MTTPSPSQFTADLRQSLAAQVNPARAKPMAAYMKQHFVFFGIPTPARRAAVKPLIATLGKAPDADWLLAAGCWLWRKPCGALTSANASTWRLICW